MSESEKEFIILLYTGERATHDGQHRYTYYVLNDAMEKDDSNDLWLKRKMHTAGRAGTIIKLEGGSLDEDGTLHFKVIKRTVVHKYLGFWENTDEVVEWQTRSDAAKAAMSARKKQKKEAGANWIAEILEPIRSAYSKANWRERQQILALVIRHITK